ncbi:KptA family-domain-containing protein [Sparassis latifolia]
MDLEKETKEQNRKDRKERDAQSYRGKPGGKLRGRPNDSEETRISKTLSWILRHGSQSEGLAMRPDGYVQVEHLLRLPKMKSLDFAMLQTMVEKDAKKRYNLVSEIDVSTETERWWIRANQGHSMKSVKLDLKSVNSLADIPTGIAVHGTTRRAWESISEQGLSKMSRNHIHLAQGVPGDGVISMRKSSQILIYIDVQKALDDGVKFYLSDNAVVLTEGDAAGYLRPQYFSRVETPDHKSIPGWEGTPETLEKIQKERIAVDTTEGMTTGLEQKAHALVL